MCYQGCSQALGTDGEAVSAKYWTHRSGANGLEARASTFAIVGLSDGSLIHTSFFVNANAILGDKEREMGELAKEAPPIRAMKQQSSRAVAEKHVHLCTVVG